jgi:hypothetical protein
MSRRHPALNREHRVLTAADVMEILGVGQTKAYTIIKKLNAELAEKGVLKESLMGGRVPERYFYERVFLTSPPAKPDPPRTRSHIVPMREAKAYANV